jgi:hypothetical protein
MPVHVRLALHCNLTGRRVGRAPRPRHTRGADGMREWGSHFTESVFNSKARNSGRRAGAHRPAEPPACCSFVRSSVRISARPGRLKGDDVGRTERERLGHKRARAMGWRGCVDTDVRTGMAHRAWRAVSLFKAREWWRVTCGEEEEFDRGCMAVANIDNHPNGEGVMRRPVATQRAHTPIRGCSTTLDASTLQAGSTDGFSVSPDGPGQSADLRIRGAVERSGSRSTSCWDGVRTGCRCWERAGSRMQYRRQALGVAGGSLQRHVGDARCLLVGFGHHTNTKRGVMTAKIITGSLHGVLRIFHPKARDFKVEDLLLEQQFEEPILQVGTHRERRTAGCYCMSARWHNLGRTQQWRANRRSFAIGPTKRRWRRECSRPTADGRSLCCIRGGWRYTRWRRWARSSRRRTSRCTRTTSTV